MARTLFEVAKAMYSGDVGTKPPVYYERYDAFFRNNSFAPTAILEIGVHRGESTKVLATAYPNAKILALDLKFYPDLDFSAFPNVVYREADQSDKERLKKIIAREFPRGYDLAIDDASHIGAFSLLTFQAAFPILNGGGIYIVEDWGTAYWDDFPDGGRFQGYPLAFRDGNKRLPSHDFGMVGFIKSLVDMTAGPDIRAKRTDPIGPGPAIEKLEIGPGICIALKARTFPPMPWYLS